MNSSFDKEIKAIKDLEWLQERCSLISSEQVSICLIAIQLIKSFGEFKKEWGDRLGFLSEPDLDRESFLSINYVANKLGKEAEDAGMDLNDSNQVLDNVIDTYEETIKRLNLSKTTNSGSLKRDEAWDGSSIFEKEILKLRKEKREFEKMWEEFTRSMWKKNTLSVESSRILQGKSPIDIVEQLKHEEKESQFSSDTKDLLWGKAAKEIKYLRREVSIQKTIAEVSVKYNDVLKRLGDS